MPEEMALPPSESSGPPPPLRRRSPGSASLSTPSASQTPLHPSSSGVPFSWEQLPGIPKIPRSNHKTGLTLIPPPSRSRTFPHRARHRRLLRRTDPDPDAAADSFAADPFAAALAKCSKDPPAEPDFWRIRPVQPGPDRSWWSITGRLGFLDLYGSCKASCSVSEPGYRVINRRS